MADDRDPESNPGTAPFVPDFSDGEDTGSWVPDFTHPEDTGPQPLPASTVPGMPKRDGDPGPDEESRPDPAGAPVQSVTVPGRYFYLKWWKLLLVLLGVWVAAAWAGLGLFYWWYHSTDKTPPVFAVLVYVVACAVGGVMLAMAQGRPLVSALSVAVMSGPFASVAAAAPLYGYYYCTHTGHCVVGLIPY
ncbi:MAG: hypothetical protein PHQ28_03315 [Mycobacterium sp.]|nr:hypothetical protein [Mycobacterium sp.]